MNTRSGYAGDIHISVLKFFPFLLLVSVSYTKSNPRQVNALCFQIANLLVIGFTLFIFSLILQILPSNLLDKNTDSYREFMKESQDEFRGFYSFAVVHLEAYILHHSACLHCSKITKRWIQTKFANRIYVFNVFFFGGSIPISLITVTSEFLACYACLQLKPVGCLFTIHSQ